MHHCCIVGVGQRGVGYIKQLERWKESPFKVTEIYDTCKSALVTVHRKYSHLRVLKSTDDVRNSQCEVIFICTPDATHLQVLCSLLDPSKKRAFVVEKPISVLLSEHEIIRRLPSDLGQLQTLHFPLILRFTAMAKKLRNLVYHASSQVKNVTLNLYLSMKHSTSYRRRRKTHPFVKNKLVHDIDMISYVLKSNRVLEFKQETGVKHHYPVPPKNRALKCRDCTITNCIFDYRVPPNYSGPRDIEDTNDECFYGIRTDDPDFLSFSLHFEDIKAPVFVNVFLFHPSNGNRELIINFDNGDMAKLDFKQGVVYKNDLTKYKHDPLQKSGHMGGDINFLKEVEKNHFNTTEPKSTLLKESISYYQLMNN